MLANCRRPGKEVLVVPGRDRVLPARPAEFVPHATSPIARGLVPETVVVEETFNGAAESEALKEEAAIVAGAVAKRRNEFLTGRACARIALRKLGAPDGPILRDSQGAPVWPAGVIGSITHCDGYAAAAVAYATDVLTIGLDAEPNTRLPDGTLTLVADADERAAIDKLSRAKPTICWDRLFFCAKEAVFKAWFPVTRLWLEFADASVALDLGGSFVARVAHSPPDDLPLDKFVGNWLVRNGLVVVAIAAPRV